MPRWLGYLFSAICCSALAVAQDPVIRQERIDLSGAVEAVYPGEILIKDQAGKSRAYLIQSKEAIGIPLTGRTVLLRFPAKAKVGGDIDVQQLPLGADVRLEVRMNRRGMIEGQIESFSLVGEAKMSPGITVKEEAAKGAGFSRCEVVGWIDKVRKDRLLLKVPKNKFTTLTTLSWPLAKGATARLESDDFRRAGAGATVKGGIAWQLSTGDAAIEEIELEVDARSLARPRTDEALLAKFRHLSDEPQKPREVRSAHAILKTDVSERQAQIILAKLERLIPLLEKYFGKRMEGIITGFVVRDLGQWPADAFPDANGRQKIEQRGGLHVPKPLGRQRQSIIYCTDDHGTVQHESTHAYCYLAFGETGPTWLAEGIAELGNYWKEGQAEVDIEPHVLRYLQTTSPKRKLLEIAVPGRVPFGQADWKDYAWRWALCHLLSTNPNYSKRFKPLAIGLMTQQPKVSFETVYGPVARQISFEYDLFLEQFDNGYRADLCAWQWNKKFQVLRGGAPKATVMARYGWQASGIRVEQGQSYEVTADGKWKIAPEATESDADGDADGRGRLMAVVMTEYQLSAPFPLGAQKTFTAPASGDLYLRCQDEWNRLADNEGEITVTVKRAAKE
jgi:hypothetical protein